MERNFVKITVMVLAFCVGAAIASNIYFDPGVVDIPEVEIGELPRQDIVDGKALEMVFVIDTTGSMGGLIEGAKQKIWSIVNDVMQKEAQPRVKVGLVAYRDHGDAYVTKVLPLTEDLDEAYSILMDYEAAGGGDFPEAVADALADAVGKAGWSKKSDEVAQIIFLVGDAPPQSGRTQPNILTLAEKAVNRNMIVNTIQCGSNPDTRTVWQGIAQHGGGKYFAIAQDGGVETIRTPYDERISELGRNIGDTYIAYGSASERETSDTSLHRMEQKMASNTSVPTQADRAMNKAMNRDAYTKDLLQDIENGKVDISSVKEDELPDELKTIPAAERAAEVQKRIGERKKLRVEIMELSKQRAAYVESERKKLGKQAGFDAAVSGALSEQLKAKGIE